MSSAAKTSIYAVAVEELQRDGSWKADVVHVKAANGGHARNQFTIAYPNRRTCKIVAIGKAIGVFANEEDGENMSTDS